MGKRSTSILLSLLVLLTAFSGCGTASTSATNSVIASSTAETSELESSKTAAPFDLISSAIVSSSSEASSSASSNSASTAVEVAAASVTGSKLKVHYLDVGQGDSEFIELPNGQTMLIDAGEAEYGSGIISYIKALKYSKIDYLIATHPHADHIGGMTTVVNGLSIGKIYMPKKEQTTKTFENLLAAFKSKGLTVNTARSGIKLLKTENLNIDMIAPVGTSYSDLNDYSAVIKITFGSNSFLFMGDASATSEGQIMADVKADVLKVGHHGSDTATTTEFLNKVSPKYAVIEVGKGNSYGHPTAATLTKLKGAGAQVYRTDEAGTIIFTSDGKTITVDKKASSIKEQAPPATTTTTSKASTTSKSATVVVPSAGTANNQNVTVYITKSGEKYHSDGCSSLLKSKIAISLKDAKAKGYTPCTKCNPPQ